MHSACGGLVRGNDINVNPTHHQEGQCHILYDAAIVGQVTSEWFSADYWQQQQAIVGQAQGRGTTWFIRQPQGDWVLRQYHRGGMIAPLLGDRYLWTGLDNTRAWREWQLLAHMRKFDLPVPAPIAVQVCRQGVFYRAAILTGRIAASQSLAQVLQQQALPATSWQAIGQCIRRIHQAGVYHADLNAHNILLNADGQVFVIDFDRGCLRDYSGDWQESNLLRLQRSLLKSTKLYSNFYFNQTAWQLLINSYWQR